jgi:hypothetical protein
MKTEDEDFMEHLQEDGQLDTSTQLDPKKDFNRKHFEVPE